MSTGVAMKRRTTAGCCLAGSAYIRRLEHALKESEPSKPKMDRGDASSLLSPEWKSVSKKRKAIDRRTKQTQEKPQGLIEKAKCAILGTSH